jgi:hypothetical protein
MGHLYGFLVEREAHEQDQEEFADTYAFTRIKDTISDMDLRFKIYIEAFIHERL